MDFQIWGKQPKAESKFQGNNKSTTVVQGSAVFQCVDYSLYFRDLFPSLHLLENSNMLCFTLFSTESHFYLYNFLLRFFSFSFF